LGYAVACGVCFGLWYGWRYLVEVRDQLAFPIVQVRHGQYA
jgi:hypothetical protein